MTDNVDPIAYLDRLAIRHFQVGIGFEVGGFVSNLLGTRSLGTWLFSVGILAVGGSIVLRVIEFVAKLRQRPTDQSQSFGRSVTQHEMDTVARETFRLLAQAGYDETIDVHLEVRTEDGRAFLLVRGGDETARAVAQGAIKVICEEHGFLVNFEG